MPVIQDPRQNPGNEHNLGIAYFEKAFILDGVTYIPGHYFYKKMGNPNDPFNIRYLPHGFPIQVTGITEATNEDWADVDVEYYKQMFPNLVYNPDWVLKVKANEGYVQLPDPDIDRIKPMAAYNNENAFDETRGLRKIPPWALYRYDREQKELVED